MSNTPLCVFQKVSRLLSVIVGTMEHRIYRARNAIRIHDLFWLVYTTNKTNSQRKIPKI